MRQVGESASPCRDAGKQSAQKQKRVKRRPVWTPLGHINNAVATEPLGIRFRIIPTPQPVFRAVAQIGAIYREALLWDDPAFNT
jgi:hypothetical protein